jgi:hypothetical protein
MTPEELETLVGKHPAADLDRLAALRRQLSELESAGIMVQAGYSIRRPFADAPPVQPRGVLANVAWFAANERKTVI